MRYLYMAAAVVVSVSTGCARIPPALLQAQVAETERWQRQYEAEREHAEALAMRLAAAEAALEARDLERAEAEQAQALVQDELARAEAERHELEEEIVQLRVKQHELGVQQRELTEMHEELSDVWYESALSRARRHLPARPSAGADGAGGSNGGAP